VSNEHFGFTASSRTATVAAQLCCHIADRVTKT
jgi:hypothetical protein